MSSTRPTYEEPGSWQRELGSETWALSEEEADMTIADKQADWNHLEETAAVATESEARLRLLAEVTEDVLWISTPSFSRLIYVSPSYEKILGKSRAHLYESPMAFLDIVHPGDRDHVAQSLQSAGTEPYRIEFRIVLQDSETRWIRIRGYPVEGHDRVVHQMAGIATDITDYKSAVEEVERHRRLSAVVAEIEAALSGPVGLAKALDCIAEATMRYLGAGNAVAVVWRKHGDNYLVRISDWFPGKEQYDREFIPREMGATKWVLENAKPLIVPAASEDPFGENTWAGRLGFGSYAGIPLIVDGQPHGVLYVMTAEPREFESHEIEALQGIVKFAALAVVKLRTADQARQLVALRERQRLARELHDSLSQTLFSANVIAESLPRLWTRDFEQVPFELERLHRLTSGALAELRMLLLESRMQSKGEASQGEPGLIADKGLGKDLLVDVTLAADVTRSFPWATLLNLVAIAKEAITNIVKHSQAEHVTMSLMDQGGGFELVVRDDGVGFEPGQERPGRLGLKIMQERAESVGAKLEILSQPGAGSEVRLQWEGLGEGEGHG